ncbi:cytidylate kinase [Cyclonatronum proteinivorum]|uniref:Cytidylate kinase n=1 Tax=Cyclonatronum proteinivorum TaxID=1457365 RepID=A0A345UN77_9BACT|nr:(d)CMP kinase [Cyclonatronum proteinivorum]AXJ01929.1 cytidylate kinase [Cyclonatronum proteinivorum]
MIVTIDGPAGSGKSSTAKKVAEQVGWHYLDSGALYRTWTLLYVMGGMDLALFEEVVDVHDITLSVDKHGTEPLLNGEKVGDSIREQRISEHVSTVSTLQAVRDKVNAEMRRIVQKHNFVADGRDLGSVVFPDALLKIYMVADLDERAKRRFAEMEKKGIPASLQEIKDNLAARDATDSERAIAPLTKPEGAIEIDTTQLSFAEQVSRISSEIQQKLS